MGLTTQVALINSERKTLLVGTDTSGNLAAAHVMVNASGVEIGTASAPITVMPSTLPLPVSAIVTAYTTQGAGTTSENAGIFIPAIQAPTAGMIRKGGAIWNTGEQQLLIYFGPHANATAASAIPLGPGDSISCTLPSGVVLQDEVAVACSSAASQSFVVTVQ